MTEITVPDLTTTQQNELIAQLMQRMVDMKTKIKNTQELANLAITANFPGPDQERPPVQFSSLDPSHQPISISTNPPITSVQASHVVNAGTSNIFPQKSHNTPAVSLLLPTLSNPKQYLPKTIIQTNTTYLPPKLHLLKSLLISRSLTIHIFLTSLTLRLIIMKRRRKNGRPKRR